MFTSRIPTLKGWAILLALSFLICSGALLAQRVKKPGTAPRGGPESMINVLGMTFVKVPAGSFMMGASDKAGDPREGDDEKPGHRVTISRPFYLQATEVTQGQWKTVMNTTPWAELGLMREGPDYPAVNVSWEDVQVFMQKLNLKGDGRYRLPTEAEWEYACRAGTAQKYSFGDDPGRLEDFAWFKKNALDADELYPHRVATKAPNPWGLYDMHGNVAEWCQDWKGDYASGAQTDPAGAKWGTYRVVRGGSWYNGASSLRSASRAGIAPDVRCDYLGFRLLRIP